MGGVYVCSHTASHQQGAIKIFWPHASHSPSLLSAGQGYFLRARRSRTPSEHCSKTVWNKLMSMCHWNIMHKGLWVPQVHHTNGLPWCFVEFQGFWSLEQSSISIRWHRIRVVQRFGDHSLSLRSTWWGLYCSPTTDNDPVCKTQYPRDGNIQVVWLVLFTPVKVLFIITLIHTVKECTA